MLFSQNVKILLFIFSSCVFSGVAAQTLGGNAVFNFLKLSNTPQLTGLGGINVSQPSDDVGLAYNNPSLLKPEMNQQLNLVFNNFYSGINIFHLSGAYYPDKSTIGFAGGITYFNYGTVTETDAAGNVLGKFKPFDWVAQVSASKPYLEKWNFGATLKFINSNYGQYKSNGVATDVGVFYNDTAKLFSASLLVKNMGVQIKKYEGTNGEELPFDIQVGITKRLSSAPFSFSLTAQRIHRFNIRYDDINFNNQNGYANANTNNFSVGKLMDHFVLATSVFITDRIDAQVGYNFLRRRELNVGNSGNGLNGFSLGAGVKLGRLQIRYARAWYQSNTAINQFGLTIKK